MADRIDGAEKNNMTSLRGLLSWLARTFHVSLIRDSGQLAIADSPGVMGCRLLPICYACWPNWLQAHCYMRGFEFLEFGLAAFSGVWGYCGQWQCRLPATCWVSWVCDFQLLSIHCSYGCSEFTVLHLCGNSRY